MELPKRIVITKTIVDNMLYVKKIDVGTVMDAGSGDFEMFSSLHPDSFKVIEMTKEDWIDLTTKNFVDNSEKLEKLLAIRDGMGLKASPDSLIRYYSSSVPMEGKKVNPEFYGGGLSDVYYKSVTYKELVERFEKEIDAELSEKFKMTEEGWINLTTKNFVDNSEKLERLLAIRDGMGLKASPDSSIDYYSSSVPSEGKKVNPNLYGGGVSDVYNKSLIYKELVERFEKEIDAELSEQIKRKKR